MDTLEKWPNTTAAAYQSLSRAVENRGQIPQEEAAKLVLLQYDKTRGFAGWDPRKFTQAFQVERLAYLAAFAKAYPEFFEQPRAWEKYEGEKFRATGFDPSAYVKAVIDGASIGLGRAKWAVFILLALALLWLLVRAAEAAADLIPSTSKA